MKMMNSEQKHTDFSLYTFEEFLQNDFFISSMNHPTEETQKFWDEFEQMNPSNIDEYIGFLYGIISSDHDIEMIFIDSILKHADVSLGDLPVFIERLKSISETYNIDFIVSVSAEKEEMIGVDFNNCEILN